jgi:copper chaperone CopZ
MAVMKARTLLAILSCVALAGACDKSDSAAGQASKATTTAKVAETSAAHHASTAPSEEDENCAAADNEDGTCGGEDCMDKTAEMEMAMAADGEEGEAMGCNKWNEAADAVAQRDIPADAEWSVMDVSGMHCGGCERRVIANLGGLDGVYAVEADAELGQVRVAYAKGNAHARDAARAKIGELGYKVQ